MQGVDLAIVELQPTLETLIDDGIQPLALDCSWRDRRPSHRWLLGKTG
ncbi:Trypsin domain protein [Pseudomonas amygdali pv. morsprunorum]|uniref:Uncharacterized protein n=1 Tax=Pseudomonas syringae TaxID=317 RepID=A0A2K4WN43_PSESX|nr:Trypsin domain protein [Pseudomonas amygdali pv. morsprunorum]RMO94334.1 Trypsin domain protein [Pseudomonas amygdali pv. morsprunorum]RMU29180.1 Trypsin domain protein [Pseudomonas amygdali pv. morsprunorum]SOS37333.1 hypothetical protein CFBP3840_00257 [Pseudomonas syringae]SPD84780.1 hypothetical protein PSCFBP2116_05297 [Pseudomonas syringae]